MAGGGVAYAAEAASKAATLTKEQAIQKAQSYVKIPADYKLADANFFDPEKEGYFMEGPSWRLYWDQGNQGRMSMTIDAVTGQLLQYYTYGDENRKSADAAVGEEKALAVAEEFLQKVLKAEEMAKLSKPNEFSRPRFTSWNEYGFSFTRMENNIPFLENGVDVTVSRDGAIARYDRIWSPGPLPEVGEVLSQEEAEKQLAELTRPSLVFAEKSFLTGDHEVDYGKYQLVYRYTDKDPQFLDARTGAALNLLGQEAVAEDIQPLGSTVKKPIDDEKTITKEEAQKIADQVIKLLPGSYRSEGNRGSGGSTGPDGITRRSWSFEYTPLHIEGKTVNKVELEIGDRGELVGYSSNERRYPRETGKMIDKAVPYEQAVESAIKLVKTLLADQLGEIYLIDRAPSAKELALMHERGQYYTIPFGKMKGGIPIESAEFEVVVHPETGEAESLNLWRRSHSFAAEETVAKIDREAAKKAEQERKKVMLTYLLPQMNYYGGTPVKREPVLVYRYVGERGVVDAVTGEWMNLDKLNTKSEPSDIAEHPDREALVYAWEQGMFTVTDGKLEPDQEMTRGEVAKIAAKLLDRIEFHRVHYVYSGRDEEEKPYVFEDVDSKHPLYGVIQKSLQYGLIAKEGKRFEPDRLITRAEMADLIARLLGYGDLLNKTEIFTVPYGDLQKQSVPAAAIAYAHGLMTDKGKQSFQPNATLTRADMAKIIEQLMELKKEER